ncbi:hypothetical protein [Paracidovorax sp. MALMAid1276]|uniref:hypothetical protein n=1 Tax=Paracidovorax sp. MALMAid1276 TaxID=3411631 RepID=UPI003B9D651F
MNQAISLSLRFTLGPAILAAAAWLPTHVAAIETAPFANSQIPSITATKAGAETKKRKGVSKVTYQRSSSEETPAQRDKRMTRECKGLPNAGACRGYTR